MADLVPGSDPDADNVDGVAAATPPKKKLSKKMLIIGGAVLLAIGGTTASVLLLGDGEEAHEPAEAEHVEYVEIPSMLINIRSADGRQRFLKVRLTLETTPEAKEELTAKLPSVIDAMQTFLRELRPEDLASSAGMFRIKEELLVRADRTVGHGQVSDVLIQELVQQ